MKATGVDFAIVALAIGALFVANNYPRPEPTATRSNSTRVGPVEGIADLLSAAKKINEELDAARETGEVVVRVDLPTKKRSAVTATIAKPETSPAPCPGGVCVLPPDVPAPLPDVMMLEPSVQTECPTCPNYATKSTATVYADAFPGSQQAYSGSCGTSGSVREWYPVRRRVWRFRRR